MDAEADTRPSLTIKRHIKGPPAQVFAAWTDPAKIARWFGPKGASEIRATIDARVGGRFHYAFRTPDGEMNDAHGVYREVVPDAKLVFTWAWKSTPERQTQVTVLMKPDGAGTMMTLIHEQFADEAVRDNHQTGWSGAVDKLEKMFT